MGKQLLILTFETSFAMLLVDTGVKTF